jgi:hypothetical protein
VKKTPATVFAPEFAATTVPVSVLKLFIYTAFAIHMLRVASNLRSKPARKRTRRDVSRRSRWMRNHLLVVGGINGTSGGDCGLVEM